MRLINRNFQFMKRSIHIPPPINIIVGQKIKTVKKQRSRELRKSMTEAEKLLWNYLRHNKLNGLHFRRQQIIDGVIADFYCHRYGLVIEIDGALHEKQKEYDVARDKILANRKLKVIRFSNEEVLKNLDGVLQIITNVCQVPRT